MRGLKDRDERSKRCITIKNMSNVRNEYGIITFFQRILFTYGVSL